MPPRYQFQPAKQQIKPAYDAYGQVLFYANAANIYTGSIPAAVDLSSRVLKATRTETEAHTHANVLLDNRDGGATWLTTSPDIPGDRADLSFGYAGSAGTEISTTAPLWISAVHNSGKGGTHYVELVLHDGWHLLANWHPRRLYGWLPG